MHALTTAALAACLVSVVPAQEFEVASVKLSAPAGRGTRFGVNGGPGTTNPGTMTWSTTSLVTLLATAYAVRPDQIANPQNLSRAAYDVIAKLPAGSTKEQIPAMMRKVLEERFHLAAHTEMRESAVYLMSVARTGSKLKAADEAAQPPASIRTLGATQVDKDFFPIATRGEGAVLTFNGNSRLAATAVTVSKLADLLTSGAGRPVIDNTGLKGLYDVKLSYSAQQSGNNAPPPPGSPTGLMGQSDESPDIFSALQRELGLRLDAGKSAVKFIVIDHIDKAPTEN